MSCISIFSFLQLALTPQDQEALNAWLTQPTEPCVYRHECLLKLSLDHNVPNSESVKHLETYRDHLCWQQKKLANIGNHIHIDHAGRADQRYLLMIYRYAHHTMAAKLAWCDECLANLAARA